MLWKLTNTNRVWLDLSESQSDVAMCRYKRSKARGVMARTVTTQTRMAVCRYQRSRAHIVMAYTVMACTGTAHMDTVRSYTAVCRYQRGRAHIVMAYIQLWPT